MRINKILLVLLFLSAQAYSNEWNGIEYDEAKLYYFNFEDHDYKNEDPPLEGFRLIEDNKLGSTVVNKNGYLLSKNEINEFLQAFSKTEYESGIGLCYEPRHGIVLYKNNVIQGYIEWCLECQGIVSKPEAGIDISHLDWGKIALLVGSTGIPINKEGTTAKEYSEEFYKQIKLHQEWSAEQKSQQKNKKDM